MAWALRFLHRQEPPRGSLLLAPLGGAVLWGLLQLVLGTTVYRFVTWNAVLYWLTALVLVFVSLQALSGGATREAFLKALLWFGLAVSVIAVLQVFTSGGKVFWIFPSGYTDRVFGPFVYHNNFAAFIELLLPLALYQALRDRRHSMAYTAMAGAMYASVIASTSRAGATLATLEIAAVLSIAAARREYGFARLRTVALLVAGCAGVFTAVVGPRALWERFRQPDPYVLRREMHQSALAMARERPWLGFGLGTFEAAYPAYALFDIGLVVNHAHNDWAEWLAEGGVPFLLLMLGMALWSVWPALRSVWGIGVLSVFAHALVDYPMQRLGLAAWVFVLLGALAARRPRGKPRAF